VQRAVPVTLRGDGEHEALALEVTDDGVIVALDRMLPADALIETEFADPWSDRRFRVFGEVLRASFLVGFGGQAMPAAEIRFFGLDDDGRALLRDFVSAHFAPRGLEAV
jgi:hypothetical protein